MAIAISRSTTTPLRGTADLNFAKTGTTNEQGKGFSYDITLSSADKAKMLYGSFDYEVISGTYVTGDLTVYIYDITNAVVIQPAGYQIQSATVGTTMKHIYSFQTASNSTSYRVCWHVASTSALDYTLAFDNMQLGPATIQGTTVVASEMYISGADQTVSSASPTKVAWNAVVRDSHGAFVSASNRYVIPISGWYSSVASLNMQNITVDEYYILHLYKNGSSYRQYSFSAGATNTNFTMPTYTSYYVAGDYLEIFIDSNVDTSFAITGSAATFTSWTVSRLAGPEIVGQDSDTRVVAAIYNTSSQTIEVAGSGEVVALTNRVIDTHSAYSSGTYTVPVPGLYRVSAIATLATGLWTSGNVITLAIRKNTVAQHFNRIYPLAITDEFACDVDGIISCVAGDTIDILIDHNRTTGDLALSGTANVNTLSINRISGPSAIAASEQISLLYVSAGATSVAVVDGWKTLTFATKVNDSHGSFSGTTFTAPISGTYQCTFKRETGSSTSGDRFYGYIENGVQKFVDAARAGEYWEYMKTNTVVFRLLAGQTFLLNGNSGASTLNFVTADPTTNSIAIARIGNY